jgi:hypothetical protein
MRPALYAALVAVSSALRPALLPTCPRHRGRTQLGSSDRRGFNARPRCRPLRAVDDEAQTAYNPATEILDETKKKGFLAPAPSPTAAAGARRAAEYLANPRFEVLSAAITLLSCAAYAFNTLNDLPETVATALPVLEKGASAFFLAEYLARFYSRGFDARRGPVYTSSRGLMDKASPS